MDGTFIVCWSDDFPSKESGPDISKSITTGSWPASHPADYAAIERLKPGETFVDSETDPETGIPLVLVHRIS